MRVAIAGAGVIGRSIAAALLAARHEVLLIERDRPHFRPELVQDADWMLADACELSTLQAAGIDTCDVVIAATGDDKVNLVFSMLCKTEYAVPQVAARVNDPDNQWMFGDAWGVDVAVSTPGALVAGVEEAVSLGTLVRLMTLRQGDVGIVEITLTEDSPLIGCPVSDVRLPGGAAILTILRDGSLAAAVPDERMRAGDEIILVAAPGADDQIRAAFHVDE
jgi:trk system potassium uptake protein